MFKCKSEPFGGAAVDEAPVPGDVHRVPRVALASDGRVGAAARAAAFQPAAHLRTRHSSARTQPIEQFSVALLRSDTM